MNYIDTQPQQAPRTKLWQGAERDTPRSGFRSMLPDNAYSRQDRIVQTGRDNSRAKLFNDPLRPCAGSFRDDARRNSP